MRNHCVDKIISVVMTLIVQQIHIKIAHYKKKFIFFGYLLHTNINVIVEVLNICIRMSIRTAAEIILTFSIFNFNPTCFKLVLKH